MYANCGDTGKYQELVTEVEQLKALLLFHLDLIQQQSECNASKDKQLSELRQENEMVCWPKKIRHVSSMLFFLSEQKMQCEFNYFIIIFLLLLF